MALTATYDPLLSRIRLAATALGAGATYAVVTRSTDNWITSTVVRGGSRVIVSGAVASLDDYEFPAGVSTKYRIVSYNNANVQQATFDSAPITQDLDGIWLKVPAAPFLNRKVTVTTAGGFNRPAVRAEFPIMGKDNPVVVTGRRQSLRYNVSIRTFSFSEESDLELLLATGETIFFHLPADETCMRGGYYDVGDLPWDQPQSRAKADRIFVLPLTMVDAPGPDIVGSSYTWNAVVADYATWNDLIAANATWNDLLQHTASPSDTIVN